MQAWEGPEHIYFGHDARRGTREDRAVCVCIYMHTYMHACTHTRVCACVCVCVCVCVCACIYICMYVCMYVCTYVCLFVCMYVCMYIYICIYIYRCTALLSLATFLFIFFCQCSDFFFGGVRSSTTRIRDRPRYWVCILVQIYEFTGINSLFFTMLMLVH